MNIFKSLSVKAVIFGFITQILATLVLSIALGIILKLIYQTTYKETNVILFSHDIYLFIAMLLGLLACGYGGFIAATSSKTDNLNNSIVLGIIIALISLYQVLFVTLKTPGWENIISLVLVLPSTYWGGFLSIKYKKQKSSE